MKRYMLSILPLFLALCLMAGCGGRSAMHSRLAAVDSIVDSRPLGYAASLVEVIGYAASLVEELLFAQELY